MQEPIREVYDPKEVNGQEEQAGRWLAHLLWLGVKVEGPA